MPAFQVKHFSKLGSLTEDMGISQNTSSYQPFSYIQFWSFRRWWYRRQPMCYRLCPKCFLNRNLYQMWRKLQRTSKRKLIIQEQRRGTWKKDSCILSSDIQKNLWRCRKHLRKWLKLAKLIQGQTQRIFEFSLAINFADYNLLLRICRSMWCQ